MSASRPNSGVSRAKQGRWVERWMKDDEAVVLRGMYQTMWRSEGDRWLKSAEPLIALDCDGPYCSDERLNPWDYMGSQIESATPASH